ncbi:MAG: hypothetical protein M1818_006756 [Claussenomyces sp. TS43310]|nr:MAG: hypothetical protein M1818_006756 [Claussenomyces sp. TS43310]
MAFTIPSNLQLKHLKSLAFQCGIASSGTKALLTSRLQHEISSAAPAAATITHHVRRPRGSDPIRILSIDMGIRNLAYCLLELPPAPGGIVVAAPAAALPTLAAWRRTAVSSAPIPSLDTGASAATPLAKEAFDPPALSRLAHDLLTATLLPLAPTHILIERQRFRSMGRAQILEWTVRVNTLEAILHAILHTLRARDLWAGHVIPIAPGKVGPFWLGGEAADDALAGAGAGVGAVAVAVASRERKKTRNTKSAKLLNKGAKIDLVASWLETRDMIRIGTEQADGTAQAYLERWHRLPGRKAGKTVATGTGLRSMGEKTVEEMGKLDDLADCLLQGMAWVQWERNKALVLEKGVRALHLGSI